MKADWFRLSLLILITVLPAWAARPITNANAIRESFVRGYFGNDAAGADWLAALSADERRALTREILSSAADTTRGTGKGENLARLGTEVIPLIQQSLNNSKSSAEERLALYALGEIGAPARALIPLITTALDNSDRWVRLNALIALEKMGPLSASAAPRVLRLLEDSDGSIPNQAKSTLEGMGVAALPVLAEDFATKGNARAYQTLPEIGVAALPILAKYCAQFQRLPFTVRNASWALVNAVRSAGDEHPCWPHFEKEFTKRPPEYGEIEYLVRGIQDPATAEERKRGYSPDYEALNRAFLLGAMGGGAVSVIAKLKVEAEKVTDPKLTEVLKRAIARIEAKTEPGVAMDDPYLVGLFSEVTAGRDDSARGLLSLLNTFPTPVLVYLSGVAPSLEEIASRERARSGQRFHTLCTSVMQILARMGEEVFSSARRLGVGILQDDTSCELKAQTVRQLANFGNESVALLAPYLKNGNWCLELAAVRGLEKNWGKPSRESLALFWKAQGLTPYQDLPRLEKWLEEPLKANHGSSLGRIFSWFFWGPGSVLLISILVWVFKPFRGRQR